MTETGSPSPVDAPDPRPRPQYGEYATADEQRARIRRPDATEALSSGQAPDGSAPTAGSAPAASETPRWGSQPSPAERMAAATGPQPRTRGELVDRIATILLLTYGLFNIFVTVPQLFQFEQFADAYLAVWGTDDSFTNLAQGRLWGTIAGVVLVVGWLATAFLTVLRLRRRKLAFWVPIVGAAVTLTIVAACISIPIAGDPAFAAIFDRLATSGS